MTPLSAPSRWFGWFAVWRRNLLVWRKLAFASILGNLADPLLYLLGLGFGLGRFLGKIDGVPYLTFLAAGTVAYSVMNTATFETLYSAFSRMHVQKTWEAILNTPLTLTDILIGEWVWATTKSALSGLAVVAVIWALDLAPFALTHLWLAPVILATGLAFAGLGLAVNALAPNYDFFLYYFTLFITRWCLWPASSTPLPPYPIGLPYLPNGYRSPMPWRSPGRLFLGSGPPKPEPISPCFLSTVLLALRLGFCSPGAGCFANCR